MKVKELIEELQKIDPEREIIMQSDSEGNNYSPLYSFWEGSFIEYDREAWLDKLTEKDIKNGFTEEDVRRDGQKAIFLTPLY